jgi:hypothetical protein
VIFLTLAQRVPLWPLHPSPGSPPHIPPTRARYLPKHCPILDQQWLTIFDRTLYVAINQTAAIFAAGALIFFIFQFGRQLIVEGNLTRPLQNPIWPIIVVCLLAGSF